MRKDEFWYLSYLAAELTLSTPLLLEATKVLKLVKQKNLAFRHNARCIAGAAVYLAQLTCPNNPKEERWTQKQITAILGSSETAIHKNCQYLTENLWYFYQYRRT